MKNDELLIKEVTLARYGGIVGSSAQMHGGIYTRLHVVDFTVERTITCVIDTNDNVAIDIETGDIWNLVERDDSNRILGELVSGQLYPLVCNDKDWSRISYLYQITLKSRAKKMHQCYLENKLQEQRDKQKIKNKEN